MLGQGAYEYPSPTTGTDGCKEMGLFPVDFILETILKAGLEWFRTDEMAGKKVFGHLKDPWLASKYGQAKIDEITNYVKKYEIKIVQHWSLIDANVPCISIQLMDGYEMTERAGFGDFKGNIDVLLATAEGEQAVIGRTEVGYAAISDNMQIGIHANETPDLTKYLYYLVIYILAAFKGEMENRGLQLGTFRATDLSRMNEYLPEHIYSRFINFTVFTMPSFDKGIVPIIEKIMGVHINPSDIDSIELGIKPVDIEKEAEYGR